MMVESLIEHEDGSATVQLDMSPEEVQLLIESAFRIALIRGLKMAEEADKIITMGCSVEKICPAPLLKNVIDWALDDPNGKPIEEVRQIRDEIENRVKSLVSELLA